MSNPITILSTKVIDDSLREQLRQKNIILYDENFIRTIPVEDAGIITKVRKFPPHWVFTSSKAVQLFFELTWKLNYLIPPDAIIYCLEGETLKSIEAAGFNASVTAANAKQLAEKIYEYGISRHLLFFCSDLRRDDLPDFFASVNIEVEECVLYKTILQSQAVKEEYNGILFFSPSAVKSFFMLNKVEPQTVLFCIGKTTAAALKKIVFINEIIISDQHTQEAVIIKVEEYFIREELGHSKDC